MAFRERHSEKGSGPAVVFSHGTLMDATQFDSQLDHLAERGYRALACNSRVLTGEPAPHTLDDLVEDCRALLDDLGIGKCVLAGMSVGGFMALEFALAHPERLNGLILIAATAQGYTAEEREGYHRQFDKLDVDGMVPRAFADWVAPFCFGATTLARNGALVEHWVERWATAMPARAVLFQGRSWIDKDDISARLPAIETPVLVVHGEEDRPINIWRNRNQREKPFRLLTPSRRIIRTHVTQTCIYLQALCASMATVAVQAGSAGTPAMIDDLPAHRPGRTPAVQSGPRRMSIRRSSRPRQQSIYRSTRGHSGHEKRVWMDNGFVDPCNNRCNIGMRRWR